MQRFDKVAVAVQGAIVLNDVALDLVYHEGLSAARMARIDYLKITPFD